MYEIHRMKGDKAMRIAGGVILQTVVFFFLISSLHPFGGRAFASVDDQITAELRKPDWHARLSTGPQKEMLNKSFDTLLSIVRNKGIDWRIRIRGIVLIGETTNPERAAILIRMLHNPFFNAGCPSIKRSIVIALSNIDNDPKVVEALIGAMSDPEIEVREEAIQALGTLGSDKAVPFLIGALNDRSFAIKRSAILSLSRIRDTSAVPYLKRMTGAENDPLLRAEAETALARMKS